MKTIFFTLFFALSITLTTGQVITPARTNSTIWVWSIQGRATYLEDGLKMAQPLDVGKQLTAEADIWVSDQGQVVLLCNGSSTTLRGGTHSLHDLLTNPDGTTASGFSQGTAPTPAPSGQTSGGGDEGSGFGQGVAPAPAPSGRTSGRGDEGSGFGQGVAPAPAPSGRTSGRGDEGSGFGQGAAPTPAPSGQSSGRGDEGSGFGQGVAPTPAPSGRTSGGGDEGSGFGQGSDGTAPTPAPSGRTSGGGDEGSGFGQGSDGTAPTPAPSGQTGGRSDKGTGFGDGTSKSNDRIDRQSGHEAVSTVQFIRQYNGNVSPGPVHYEWTQPGDRQICQFQIVEATKPGQPLVQVVTGRCGTTLDLRDLNMKPGSTYLATIRLTGGVADAGDTAEFQLVDPAYQMSAFQQAEMNPLYASASNAHKALLNAMELEKMGLLTAATAHYQRAYELDPYSELINAMIRTFKVNHGLIK